MKDLIINNKISVYDKNTIGGAGNWNGMDIPVFAEILTDGSINMAVPSKCAPDTMGYNKNYTFQMERRTKMIARLRAKLNKD